MWRECIAPQGSPISEQVFQSTTRDTLSYLFHIQMSLLLPEHLQLQRNMASFLCYFISYCSCQKFVMLWNLASNGTPFPPISQLEWRFTVQWLWAISTISHQVIRGWLIYDLLIHYESYNLSMAFSLIPDTLSRSIPLQSTTLFTILLSTHLNLSYFLSLLNSSHWFKRIRSVSIQSSLQTRQERL